MRRRTFLSTSAVAGLGGFTSPTATDHLFACLESEKRPEADRKVAATALYRQNSPAAHGGVVKTLKRPQIPDVQLPLILLLGQVGTVADFDLLNHLAETDDRLKNAVSDAKRAVERRNAR